MLRILLRAVFLCCIVSITIGATAATQWQVDYENSRLEFIFTQDGKEHRGKFADFDAEILFSNNDLDSSRFVVIIHTDSLDTKAAQRDQILRSDVFFDTAKWPQAKFQTESIRRIGNSHDSNKNDNRYEAQASLTLRDQTKILPFPFQVEIEETNGNTSFFGQGETVINRFDFDMAQGYWSDTSVVGEKIRIIATIHAQVRRE